VASEIQRGIGNAVERKRTRKRKFRLQILLCRSFAFWKWGLALIRRHSLSSKSQGQNGREDRLGRTYWALIWGKLMCVKEFCTSSDRPPALLICYKGWPEANPLEELCLCWPSRHCRLKPLGRWVKSLSTAFVLYYYWGTDRASSLLLWQKVPQKTGMIERFKPS